MATQVCSGQTSYSNMSATLKVVATASQTSSGYCSIRCDWTIYTAGSSQVSGSNGGRYLHICNASGTRIASAQMTAASYIWNTQTTYTGTCVVNNVPYSGSSITIGIKITTSSTSVTTGTTLCWRGNASVSGGSPTMQTAAVPVTPMTSTTLTNFVVKGMGNTGFMILANASGGSPKIAIWTTNGNQGDIKWVTLNSGTGDTGDGWNYNMYGYFYFSDWSLANTYARDMTLHIYDNSQTTLLANTRCYFQQQLKYNSNGGSTTPSAVARNWGDTYSTLPTVSRTGYTLDGWYTAASGGTKVSTQTTFTPNIYSNDGVTIYAHWTANTVTRYIYYRANGASTNSYTDSTTSSTFTTRGSGYFSKTGYTQNGWTTSTSTTPTSATYALNTTYNISSNLTLYPSWKANTYAVNYYSGTLSSQYTTNTYLGGQTKTYGTSLTLYSKSSVSAFSSMTRTGYTFAGWSTSSNGSSYNYVFGGSYTSNAALTLYPYWEALTYSVYYYSGTLSSQYPSNTYLNSQTKTYGTSLTLLSSSNLGYTLSRTGYDFYGWSTSSNGGSYNYAFSGSYTTNAALTLYPYWRAITYTLSYYSGTGTNEYSSNTLLKTQTGTYGGSVTMYSSSNIGYSLTRTGYDWIGWSWSNNGSYQATFGQTYQFAGNNDNAYPAWQIKSYEVDYYSGSYSSQHSSNTYLGNQYKTHGTNLTLWSSSQVTLTRTGYTHNGWSTGSAGTSRTYAFSGTYSTNATLVLYPYWQANTYTVRYYSGTLSKEYTTNTSLGTQTKTYGTSLTLWAGSAVSLTRTGYTHNGWSTNSSGTSKAYSFSGSYTTNGAANLYPYWQAITYTYSYYSGTGSTSHSSNIFIGSQTKTYGTALSLWSASNMSSVTKTNYHIDGWSTSSQAGTSKTYNLSQSMTHEGNLTLYPYWAPDSYTLTYKPNDTSESPQTNYTQTAVYNGAVTLRGATYTKTNYNQTGWKFVPTTGSSTSNYATGASLTWTRNTGGTLTPTWTAKVFYTATFYNESNGVYTTMKSPENGGNITLPAVPSKTGYTGQWALGSTSGTRYNGGTTYNLTANRSFYAVYTQQKSTIKLMIDNAIHQELEGQVGTMVTLPAPSKNGYTFDGWYGTSDFDPSTRVSQTEYPKTEGQILTLFGRFIVNDTTINYYVDGVLSKSQSGTPNTAAPAYLPSKTGYTFDGWYSDSSFTSKVSSIKYPAVGVAAVNYYGRQVANSYTISYSTNNGSLSFTTKTVGYNNAIGAFPTVSPIKGHEWDGVWYSGDIEVSTLTKCVGDMNLTTTCSPCNYTATFYPGNDTEWEDGDYQKIAVVQYGKAFNTSSGFNGITTPIIKDGYQFDGWFAADGTQIQPTTSYTWDDDIDITGRWSKRFYTISYDVSSAEGGAGANLNFAASNSIQFEDNLILPETADVVPAYGYTFKGWYTAATGGEEITSTNKMPAKNFIAYAQYEPIKYTVTIDLSHVSSRAEIEASFISIQIPYKQSYQFPELTFTKGYEFFAWSDNYSGGNIITENDKVLGDITIYPVLNPKKFTITFDTQGGSPQPDSYEVYYTHKIPTLPAGIEKPQYLFEGWLLNGEPFAEEQQYLWTDNITLTANWRINRVNKVPIFIDGKYKLATPMVVNGGIWKKPKYLFYQNDWKELKLSPLDFE